MNIVKPGILALVVLATAAEAQIYPGGYPGGGYPRYPGGGYPGGVGLPIPGRTSKTGKTKTDPNQPLPNFRGHLKQMDAKTISLELGDNRVLDFKRNDKTKFYKSGDEVKDPKFAAGDQLSVEAQEDQSGMTAVNVYWEKAGSASETASSRDEKSGAVDTWKDVPKDSTKEAAPKDAAAPATQPAQKPSTPAPAPAPTVARDPDDPGPPKLQRGRPADQARQHAPTPPPQPVDAPTQIATNNPPPAVSRPAEPEVETLERRPTTILRGDGDEDSVKFTPRADEPLIRKAADAALEFTETLPAYVCQEVMSRFQSESRPANFHAIDVVTTDVVYENGREDYRNIKINGKPFNRKIEEAGGAWSTGEFGTILVNLFAPYTAADFHLQRDSRAGGLPAKMYDFSVTREHSNWSIHAENQSFQPAYTGSLWIEPQSGRVLRIEMEAKGMPRDFPIDHVESTVDYQFIRLGDSKQYLLPVHSESLSCQRGTDYCSRNVIDFRNYHKYTGESSITFGSPAKDK